MQVKLIRVVCGTTAHYHRGKTTTGEKIAHPPGKTFYMVAGQDIPEELHAEIAKQCGVVDFGRVVAAEAVKEFNRKPGPLEADEMTLDVDLPKTPGKKATT